MGRERDKQEINIVEGVPMWLVTFGDMMSLLLTFFILLFSVSELKEPGKIYDLVQDFEGKVRIKKPVYGFGLPRTEIGPDGMLQETEGEPKETGTVGSSPNRVKRPEGDKLHALTVRDNLFLRLEGSISFKAGETFLLEEGRRALKKHVIPELIGGRFKVVILGHASTDEAEELEERYLLGYRRAVAVRDYLSSSGIPQPRMEVQSAGSRLLPKGGAADELSSGRQRRVDIWISPQVVGPPAEG